mgnify:CR=1 FL=1
MNANGTPNLTDALQLIEQAVNAVSLDGLPRLMGDLECLKAMADLRMRAGIPQPTASQVVGEIRYLTVDEVAARFHVAPKWLYRHKKQMPHSQPSRKVLLFPEQAITKWFASRKQA